MAAEFPPTEIQTSQTTEPGRIARPGKQANTGLMRWLPGLITLRQYDPSWLRYDLVAGLALTTMLVPVGIAYAEAAGLPGINGLYATIVPLLAYALFGPSRILVLGPDSGLAAVILAAVMPLSAGDPQRAVPPCRRDGACLGHPVRWCGLGASGLHHRIAFEANSLRIHERHRPHGSPEPGAQASRLSVVAEGLVRQTWGIVNKVLAGSTNIAALAIGGGTLVLILVLKRWPRIPGILIGVVAATVVVAAFDVARRAAYPCLVRCPGDCPRCVSPLFPWTTW